MADQQSVSANKSGVSPARKAVSTVILLIALAVLGIELRAGLGLRNSTQALEAKSEDGFFENLSLDDAKSLLAFAPTENIVQDTEMETVYQYSWSSLLRPLAQQPKSELFLVARKTDPPRAVSFYTEADEGFQLPASATGAGSESSTVDDMPVSIDGPGVDSIIPRSSGRPSGDDDSPEEPAKSEPISSEPETPSESTPEPE